MWTQQALIKAANAEAGDIFGEDIDLSGNTLVVGVPGEDSASRIISSGDSPDFSNTRVASGAAYVFVKSGSSWNREAYIKSVNTDAGDAFGLPVAVCQDTIVVGAPSEDSNATGITNGTSASSNNSASASGAIYVYKRALGVWSQEAYIKAGNRQAGDAFPMDVDCDGNLIVAAGFDEDDRTGIFQGSPGAGNNNLFRSGGVQVFRRSGVTWSANGYFNRTNDFLEESTAPFVVAVSGDTVATGWPFDATEHQGVVYDPDFGNSFSGSSGAVITYRYLFGAWRFESVIKASNAESFDDLGRSVAISEILLITGAPGERGHQTYVTQGTVTDNDSAINSGAAYIFTRQ